MVAHASDVEPTRVDVTPTETATPGETWTALTPGPSGPAPGELKIKERRSWRTWQLVVVGAFFLLIGMIIGNSGSGSASNRPNAATYTLPPAGGSGGSSSSSTSTSAPSTSTTAQGGGSDTSTSTTGASQGSPRVLLGPTQSRGSWTSQPFTIAGGTWNIGWAYRCIPAPASGPAFQIFVTAPGANPGGTPAVSETADQGQNVTSQATPGNQVLQIQAPSSCTWIVKVTGVG